MLSLPVALGILFLVSVVFDRAIQRLDKVQPHHPFTSIFVMVGVLYTLVIVYMVDGYDASMLTCRSEGWLRWDHILLGFVSSGIPMIWGNVARWFRGQ